MDCEVRERQAELRQYLLHRKCYWYNRLGRRCRVPFGDSRADSLTANEQPMRSLLTLGPAANRPIKLMSASRSDGSVSIGSWLKLIIICMDTCAEQHALCTTRYNACCITMLHRQLAEVDILCDSICRRVGQGLACSGYLFKH